MTSSNNTNLGQARANKEDEFYTQLSDIEKELRHYHKHFRDKIVYLNCDDPRVSNFFHYFSYNFTQLSLNQLIATCYRSKQPDLFSSNDSDTAISLVYQGSKSREGVPAASDIGITPLKGDGDFRSSESVELLKQADIVVTNPPFSLFREYLSQLVENNKHFVILGNHNALTYREVFTLVKDGKIWLGNTCGDMAFRVPAEYAPRKTRFWIDADGQKWRSFGNMTWFTNLETPKRSEHLLLYKSYSPEEYPKFDNYDAINVNRVADIPVDYRGVMGVPITFLNRHNPNQFEIVGLAAGNIRGLAGVPSSTGKDGPYINGKLKYGRILIRHRDGYSE